MEEETVTIPKSEYEELKKRDLWLQALEDAGVDNWSGMDCAHDLLKEYQNGN